MQSSIFARKQGLLWFACLGLSAAACATQNPVKVTHDASSSSACGPPEYCARTDRRVEAYPEKPPEVGPAGSILNDPTFGSRILRVTDSRSDPRLGGYSLFTPASAEQNSWNKTTTMFYVTTFGGSFQLYNFDAATMTARPANTPKLNFGAEPQFSFQQANILYGINRRDRTFERYDTSSGKLSEVNDPSKCVKLASGDSANVISVSADDNRFMAPLGPRQDNYYLVFIYDRAQGCRWYNTQTGEIGGQWGPKGTISSPHRFLLHNARMAKSGKFVYMKPGGGSDLGHGWVVWEIDSMNISVCSRGCSGHHVLGYSNIIGPSGISHPLDLWVRPLSHPDTFAPLISGLELAKGFWYDSHFSWNNVDPSDSAPVCFSTYRPTNPNTPGSPLLVTGPWQNEIDCAETDGKTSKVWRFAHTYSTARNGFWSTPRGNVSQDGRFFMFTSDWQDQLGKTPTGDKYRTDVFIVELK